MPKYKTVYFNGSGYVVSTTIEPIIGDYAICRSMFDDNPIVKVIANDGVYISYLVNNEVVQHPLSCTSKIMASTDKSLGLPAIQEEMLPYVEFVELTIKLWAAKEDREFYVTCEYDALDDIITLYANNHIGTSWEMLIFKARGKFMLTNIKIVNGKKKKVSTTEYDRLLMLLGEIFNL